MLPGETPEEARLRRTLLYRGWVLLRAPSADTAPAAPSGFMVGSVGRNTILFGHRPGLYSATLAEVAEWLAVQPPSRPRGRRGVAFHHPLLRRG